MVTATTRVPTALRFMPLRIPEGETLFAFIFTTFILFSWL